jgi:hypothetical protein
MATVNGKIVIPTNPIKRGVNWGAVLTFGGDLTDVSGIVFTLVFKRNGVTITTLNDAVEIVHTSATVLTLSIDDSVTTDLSTGFVTGDLLGVSGSNTAHYLTIETEVV